MEDAMEVFMCDGTLNLLRGTTAPGWVQVRREIREMVTREDRWLGICTLGAPLGPCHHSQKAAFGPLFTVCSLARLTVLSCFLSQDCKRIPGRI